MRLYQEKREPASVVQSDASSTGDKEVAGRFPPGLAKFFRGHSLPYADSRKAVVSFWRKNVHKYWLIA